MGRHTSKPVLADKILGFKSKHTATIYIYLILEDEHKPKRGFELGTRGRHKSKPVLADELLGFKSKYRATIYIYCILEDEQKPKQGF